MEDVMSITPSLEDYLEAVLFLTKENGNVRVTDIANHLGLSKPSVNKAINNLKNMALVSHEHYGQLTLTEKGRKIAVNIAKRHVILTGFLFKYLGVDAETAEKEACLMEHAMSLGTIEKLEAFLKKCNPDSVI
ncbi:MAG: metal-dependent transcriptional regulator [Clostridiales bacterium]|jgi:DtxR family Mn-dependent transcriptional regulator|nr:metal-dependent transcriptional regulator [Clostridiales bacterium]